mmetsp:Transcript_31034/g.59601  ORF Transcript_31034/g.59601 Transcript_31034/m.59601 type:complete len:311 (+) Transcript_31034:269-1201(+)
MLPIPTPVQQPPPLTEEASDTTASTPPEAEGATSTPPTTPTPMRPHPPPRDPWASSSTEKTEVDGSNSRPIPTPMPCARTRRFRPMHFPGGGIWDICLRLRVGGRRSWRGASEAEAEAEVSVTTVEERDEVRDRDGNRRVRRAGKGREEPWWRRRLLPREGGLCPWKNSSGRVSFRLEEMGTTRRLVVTSCRRHLLGRRYLVPTPITASLPHIHRYWLVLMASSEANPAWTAEIPIPMKPTASLTMALASCDNARHSDPKIDFLPSCGAVPTTAGAFGDVPNPKSDCRGIAASKTNGTCMPLPRRPSEPT